MVMMDKIYELFEYMDLYCERIDPGFLGEPLNMLSSMAYVFVAAAFLWMVKNKPKDIHYRNMAIIAVSVGATSTIFHAWPMIFTEFFDLIAVSLFAVYFFWYAVQKLLNTSPVITWVAMGALGGAFGACAYFITDENIRNHTMVFGIFAILCLMLIDARFRLAKYYAALGLFVAAIASRMLDTPLCNMVPIGTHWLWHIFSAIAVFFLLWVCIDFNSKKETT